ncbi:MAG: MerR family transcriptional regulator, light-induced transcriptional regulator, partial [Gaiellales bacterium]|nr:MerR family transcriptional regulator, light-induced transcriptional regulator [Gaiellales bacterium]
RIGELSRRVGVSAELLRAWERRYGLLAPTRTEGGFRLYGDEDERRVRRMIGHLDAGVSAAEGARLALLESDDAALDEASAPHPGALAAPLRHALDEFDEAAAHAAFDRLLATFALDTVLRDAVLPYLHELGERWQRGDASVAQEHFASALLRGRLLGLARGWGNGSGPRALLACVPGEQHDLALITFGLALRGQGWRITFLGPDTPLETIADTARLLRPALVVVAATTAEGVRAAKDGLAAVATTAPLALAGSGVSASIAADVGALHLEGDPVSAAARVARGIDARSGGG